MRTLLIAAAVALTLFSCKHQNKHTGLKEYGYKGHVKRIEALIYDTTSTQLIPDLHQSHVKTIYFFDRQGNFDSIQSSIRSGDYESWYSMVYHYENNSCYIVTFRKDETTHDTTRVEWKSDSNYLSRTTNPKGFLVGDEDCYLDKNYRFIAGVYNYYNHDGKLDLSERNQIIRDKDGTVVEIVRTDLIKNITIRNRYENSKPDKFGNFELTNVVNEADGMVNKVVMKKFEYY